MKVIVLVALLLLNGASASAEVVDSGEHGFTVRNVVSIAAHPSRAFSSAVVNVGRWWHPDHSFSGNARNLTLDPRPGGCLCERLTNGGVTHLTVIYVVQNQEIRFAGALGPLQRMAVTGSMMWKWTESNGNTELEWTYVVGGYRPGGLAAIASAVDAVLATQAQRLKRFIETGQPD